METSVLLLPRLLLHRARAAARAPRRQGDVAQTLFEPILHPSTWRLRALGLATLLGHPLYGWVWTHWLPQPWESPALRACMSGLGALLLVRDIGDHPSSPLASLVCTAVFWVTLPLFFSWMYLCNGGNAVWLASVAAMVLIYYQMTDWRLATLGCASGGLLAWALFAAFGPALPARSAQQTATAAMVIGFSWSLALVLGLSSSNLRRAQLKHTLATMGILAHELRTPLSTMALIGDAVRAEAQHCGESSAQRLELMGSRLQQLVRNMNHQVDAQIGNARLLRLPRQTEPLGAAELVHGAVRDYPYRSTRERECVVVQVRHDFTFEGSRALFTQVIDNLLKNALKSLAAATSAARAGDLLVEVGTLNERGRIVVTDRGMGIEPALQRRIFEPFFSTDRGTGHGLGLAFCERVVRAAHGSIRVKSIPAEGAIFTIELPLRG